MRNRAKERQSVDKGGVYVRKREKEKVRVWLCDVFRLRERNTSHWPELRLLPATPPWLNFLLCSFLHIFVLPSQLISRFLPSFYIFFLILEFSSCLLSPMCGCQIRLHEYFCVCVCVCRRDGCVNRKEEGGEGAVTTQQWWRDVKAAMNAEGDMSLLWNVQTSLCGCMCGCVCVRKHRKEWQERHPVGGGRGRVICPRPALLALQCSDIFCGWQVNVKCTVGFSWWRDEKSVAKVHLSVDVDKCSTCYPCFSTMMQQWFNLWILYLVHSTCCSFKVS